MTKKYIIFLTTFISGLLICGIGFGIGFAEFSKLSYGSHTVLGSEDIVTEDIYVDLFDGPHGKLLVESYTHYDNLADEILPDENTPLDKLRFEVSYNKELLTPYPKALDFSEVNKGSFDPDYYSQFFDEYDGQISISFNSNYSFGRELSMFMTMKDYVLRDLKNNVIGSYEWDTFPDVKIYANPANLEKLTLIYY